MKFFSRKQKVTPAQMASDIWGAYVQIMQHEFAESNNFDREAFIEKHGFDYDKKRFVKEASLLYAFMIHNEVSRFYPEKKQEILKEFNRLLIENDMDFLLDGIADYSKAWDDSVEREKKMSDGSGLNNPIYCVSKLASMRCFGDKDGIDATKIIMFSSFINPFVEMLHDNFNRYKVI